MIVVNINRSGAHASTEDQLRQAASGWWVVSEASLNTHGDYLLGVRKNIVVGAWSIEGWDREDDGKIIFKLGVASEELLNLVGQPSPVEWKQGQANPVKVIDTRTLLPEASEIEVTSQGNRRVQLDGWSLIVYADGKARLHGPDTDRKLVIESAFPGPGGGNVTVRLLDKAVAG